MAYRIFVKSVRMSCKGVSVRLCVREAFIVSMSGALSEYATNQIKEGLRRRDLKRRPGTCLHILETCNITAVA